MIPSKTGRPAKSQRICSECRKPCLPKDGDWFFFRAESDQQSFVCKKCEKLPGKTFRRTTPVRIMAQ